MAKSRVEAGKRKMNLKYAVISESNKVFKNKWIGTSLVVQWLRLCASNAGGTCSIPGGGTKIPHAVWCGQKEKIKQ